jgi:hypothetical protein
MSSVRGPKDNESDKINRLLSEGIGRSIKHVMSDIAGFEIEDIVALGAQIAIDNAIHNGTPIDIVSLVNQHNEWQQMLV